MTITEKIDSINNFVHEKSSYTCYGDEWQFMPFDGGIFSVTTDEGGSGKYYHTTAPTFEELVDKVYDIIQKEGK